jgi:PAS domain S-box-containing protein
MDFQGDSKEDLINKLLELQQRVDSLEASLADEKSYQMQMVASTKRADEFRHFIETINDVVYEITLDGTFKYISPAIEKLLGYKSEELIGTTVFNIVYPGDIPDLMKRLVSNDIADHPFFDLRFLNKDGAIRWARSFPSKVIKDEKVVGRTGFLTDISQQKLVEIELQKSEAALNQAQEISGMGSWELNLKTNELSWSKNLYQLMEIPFNSTINQEIILDRVYPQDLHLMNENQEKIRLTRKPQSFEFRLRMSDNHYKWIQNSIVPEFEGEELVRLRGVNFDVTEKKESEEKLKQQYQRFNAIISAIPDMIFVIDRNGKFLEVFAPDMEKLLLGPDQFIGQHISEVLSDGLSTKFMDKINESLVLKSIISVDYDLLLPNSTSTNFEARITPLDEDKVLILSRDISDQVKKDQEIKRLSLAVEQSPVSIEITDLNANIEYVNPALLKTSGYNLVELIGENATIFKSGQTDQGVYRDLWNTISTGKQWQGEWINKKKNGELYWESSLITPIQNNDGVIANYLAIKQDITQRKQNETEILELNANLENKVIKRTAELAEMNANLHKEIEVRRIAEDELKKTRMEADLSNLAKSEFLSRMSHELRTPMNSILGFSQLLMMGNLDAGQEKGVNHIIRSGKYLLELINEVLDISRIEAGRLLLTLEPVQLSGVIYEMIDIVNPLATNRHINIDVLDFPANQFYVFSDIKQLKQVLLNLLNNAIKYNVDNGKITIKNELHPVNGSAKPMVRTSITDTGSGISESDLFRIFLPFERIGAEKSDIEGTGLGLSVVKKLMDAMGGNVGVESVPGEGSTFWIELPLYEKQIDRIENPVRTVELESGPILKSGTILYIEDNISNIELFEHIISTHRPEIRLITTSYGEQTVGMAIMHRPDLVLLDLNLPDIHGSEVLRLLLNNEKTNSIPVIIISADAMPYQLEMLLDAGAKNYLTKPIDILNTLQLIDEYMGSRS